MNPTDRIFMSKLTTKEWIRVNPGREMNKYSVGEINNVGTLQVLGRLAEQQGVPIGATAEGEITRASHPVEFDELTGGSVGDPLMRGMVDEYNPQARPYLNLQPTKINWRITRGPPGPDGRVTTVKFGDGVDDALVTVTLG